jgi:MinD-like ATPase involved in chromosome partitioning or flagellar assembly
MSVVVVGSFSGAPGATTAALALAASWPEALYVEADPQGGRVAARFGLGRQPGVISFAAARDRSGLADHAQRLPGGLAVVVGSEAPEAAEGLWASSGAALAAALAHTPGTVVVDVGRIGPRSPVWTHLAPVASRVVVMVRNDPGDLAVAAASRRFLGDAAGEVGLVLAGSSPYRAEEVAATLGVAVVATLPWDPAAAAAVSAGTAHRNLRRSPWARALRDLAEALAVPAGGRYAVSLPTIEGAAR